MAGLRVMSNCVTQTFDELLAHFVAQRINQNIGRFAFGCAATDLLAKDFIVAHHPFDFKACKSQSLPPGFRRTGPRHPHSGGARGQSPFPVGRAGPLGAGRTSHSGVPGAGDGGQARTREEHGSLSVPAMPLV